MRPLDLLDRPWLWELSRVGLDAAFGLYRKRVALLSAWGVLSGRPSLLDIGCGIGQYARVTEGDYLGVDLNARYVEHARARRRGANRQFRCADVTTLHTEGLAFDVVLMVDVLHHLSDAQCVELLGAAGRLARRHVVSFEPVTEQTHPVGRWIVDNDRGDHVRPLRGLHGLFEAGHLSMERSVALRLGPIDTRAVLCAPNPGPSPSQ